MQLKTLLRVMSLMFVVVLASACNFNTPEATPTVEVLDVTPQTTEQLPTSTLTTSTPTLQNIASSTPRQIALATLEPTNTLPPPTLTPTPTETPGPYEYVVQSGDTLYGIIQRFGYRDFQVVREVVALNPNVPNENSLPVNDTILIPRQTSTPTPFGFEITATAIATSGIEIPVAIPTNAVIDCHVVQEGDTIISIAEQYNTTIEILSELNLDIVFSGCDFNNRSGGADCNVLLSLNQCVRVPFPTPTPTLSPTPSGSETATPTPTFIAPRVLSPPNGWTVRGAVELSWVSVGVLEANEYYFVEVVNTDTGEQFTTVVKDTVFELPVNLIPPSGQAHTINWRVFVVRQNQTGTAFTRIGSDEPYRTFIWQS